MTGFWTLVQSAGLEDLPSEVECANCGQRFSYEAAGVLVEMREVL